MAGKRETEAKQCNTRDGARHTDELESVLAQHHYHLPSPGTFLSTFLYLWLCDKALA
jgi:hypothetical protein